MNYRENNIEALKEHRPFLLERMEEWEEQGREPLNACEEIYETEARDGNSVLHVVRDGTEYRLNSPYRPLDEAQRWTEQFNFKNLHTNVVLFGMGNFLFVNALMAKLQDDATVALYEPCISIWLWAVEHVDLSGLIRDKRVYFIIEDLNKDDLVSYLNDTCHWTSVGSQITSHHTGYDKMFAESYRDELAVVQRQMNLAVVNRDTQAFFSHHYVLSSIRNLEYLCESTIITDYLEDFPRDLPVIIVSAGPSLDKNIDLLREAKGHSFILATDSAVKFLLQHDILPDAMVTIDTRKPASHIADERVQNIPLFCSQESANRIMSFHTGKKIWFKGGAFLSALFTEQSKKFPPYNVGGSVATAAFMIAISFKAKNVILIGQDLAYSGGATHAGGTVTKIINEDNEGKIVEGIDGKPVKSRHDWLIYLNWFEESIRELEKADWDMHVIDATEGGAKIRGTEIKTLRETLDEYCDFTTEFDVVHWLSDKAPSFDSEQLQDVIRYLEDCGEELEELQSMGKDAAAICDKALKLMDTKETGKNESKRQRKKQRYIDQIMNYNSSIEKKKSYQLIDIYISDVASKLLRGIFQVSDDEEKDERELLQNASAIYSAVGSSVEELLPEYEAMLERIKERAGRNGE